MLSCKNLKSNHTVIHSWLEFLPLLLTVDDQSKFEGLFIYQVLHHSIIKVSLKLLRLLTVSSLVQAIIRLVKFQVLSDLLKQLEQVLASLESQTSQEEWPHHLIVNLDVLSVSAEVKESLGILLKALASLEE